MTAFPHPQNDQKGEPDATALRGLAGTLLLMIGTALMVVTAFNRSIPVIPYQFLRFEVIFFAGGLFAAIVGAMLLKEREGESGRWQPTHPGVRFDRVVIYTRADCHLCDVAKDVLFTYQQYLPRIEEVDVDTDSELRDQFGEEVPVVAIDGRVRFRGRINEALLQRLIEGTPV